MGAPIMHGEHLLGVLQLGASPSNPFDAMDVEIVTGFAARVALALNHSRLYEDALVALDSARARDLSRRLTRVLRRLAV